MKKKYKKKLILALGIIFLLIAIVFSVWFINDIKIKESTKLTKQDTPQQQVNNEETLEEKIDTIDTIDWQTYRNEEYGFEVKYPDGWSISESYVFKAGLPSDGSVSICKKSQEKCNTYSVSFSPYQKNVENLNKMFVIQKLSENDKVFTYLQSTGRENEWMEGMITGCFSRAMRDINGKKFIIWNRYEVDNEKGDIFQNIKEKCNNYSLNPAFYEILKSFKEI